MGRRGPTAAPVAIQEIRGARESRINRSAPALAPGLPDKPDGMIEGADAIWDLVLAELGPSGAITRIDGESVRIYAEAVAIRISLVAIYEATGAKAIVRNRVGDLVENPILRALERATIAVHVAAKVIGADPASRPGIRVVRPDSADPFERFLSAPEEPKRSRTAPNHRAVDY